MFVIRYNSNVEQLPPSITLTIVLLTAFLIFVSALKFTIEDHFKRTRLMMTSFFFFIIATLTISFREYTLITLPFTIPAFLVGVGAGYLVGVRAAEARIKMEGAVHYMQHFAHVHLTDFEHFNWWSVINFYTVMSALALINLVGLTTVLFHNTKPLTLLTSAVGAFLIGSIVPYLIHLWSIRVRQKRSKTASEA